MKFAKKYYINWYLLFCLQQYWLQALPLQSRFFLVLHCAMPNGILLKKWNNAKRFQYSQMKSQIGQKGPLSAHSLRFLWK